VKVQHYRSALFASILPILLAGACSVEDPSDGQSGGAGGTGGTQASGGRGGTAGNPGSGGSTGGMSATGGTTSSAGKSGSGGTAGTGGPAGAGGTSGAAGATGAGGSAGASGSSTTGGSAGQGLGGTGTGGAGSGAGGGAGAGAGGQAGSAGASGAGGSGGSGGSGTAMKSPGCGKAPTLTSGTRSMQSGGGNRSYILRIPENYDNERPYRLIFGYHWRGGTMQDVDGGGTSGAVWSYYGLRAQADNSAIFVAPQGIGNGWPNSGGQDTEFTDDMVELIQNDLCVNTKQVFALGFSYGGGMSYSLACNRANVFRAVAVYSGGVLSGCAGGTQPVAYLGIHGLSDNVLGIGGGRDMRNRFVENNGCTSQNPPEPSGGSGDYTCTTYTGCTAGYPVRWCAFDGGHTPGHVEGGGDDGARTWTKTEAWNFFKQFE
jgi:poly(3-hydroxybutyrate) depolymerase